MNLAILVKAAAERIRQEIKRSKEIENEMLGLRPLREIFDFVPGGGWRTDG